MNEWTIIRRKVLVEKASKRFIYRDYGIGWRTLRKILAHPVPPGYQLQEPRGKPRLGPVLAIIEQILEDAKTRTRRSKTADPGASANTSPPAGSEAVDETQTAR